MTLLWLLSLVNVAMAQQSADVVVVGAGVSGLTAAYDVHKAGKSVLVLEANKR